MIVHFTKLKAKKKNKKKKKFTAKKIIELFEKKENKNICRNSHFFL